MSIDFRLLSWHVDRYNAVGLLLAFSSFCLVLAVFCFSSDISKEYDDLIMQKPQNCDSILPVATVDEKSKNSSLGDCKEVRESSSPESEILLKESSNKELWTLRDFMKLDILLITFSYSMVRLSVSTTEAVLIYTATNLFMWNILEVGVFICVYTTLFYIVVFLLIYVKFFEEGKTKMFFLFVISLCTSVCGLSTVDSVLNVNINNYIVQVAYFLFTGLCLACQFYFAILSSKHMLLSIVPDHSASFIDGFRNSCGTCFRVLGLALTYTIFNYSGFVIIPICFILFIAIYSLLYRRHIWE